MNDYNAAYDNYESYNGYAGYEGGFEGGIGGMSGFGGCSGYGGYVGGDCGESVDGLIKRKNNVIARIHTKMMLSAYYKIAMTEEQIERLQAFFRQCDDALAQLGGGVKPEAARALVKVVEMGEDVLESLEAS